MRRDLLISAACLLVGSALFALAAAVVFRLDAPPQLRAILAAASLVLGSAWFYFGLGALFLTTRDRFRSRGSN